MNSRIFLGEVMHGRLTPIKRVFNYPVYFYAFDLAELQTIEQQMPFLFGYNKWRPISIWDKDYLKGTGSIEAKIRALLKEQSLPQEISRIELITAARFFNYVFNPVSFYYCYAPDNTVAIVVAEVNNTFGERHLYILKDLKPTSDGRFLSECVNKEFHVSPFNDMHGDYDFHFLSDIRQHLDIRLNILRDGDKAFLSSQKGDALPLNSINVLRVIAKMPLSAVLTMPRILYQAGILHYLKRLKVFTKPPISHDQSFQVKSPGAIERFASAIVLRYFSRFKSGHLRVLDPRGQWHDFGERGSTLSATLKIRDYRFFKRSILSGDVGFGESFTAGEWETDDLVSLLRIFIANRETFDDRNVVWASIGKFLNRLRHRLLKRNTRPGSRKNIQYHYDLSNDFFRLFLDPSMTYSCAYFESPNESLEQGQANKIRKMIEKARLVPTDHLLEIGSGWGELAITAAKTIGCRVTTLTLSQEQYHWVKRRIETEGLANLVDVRLCDYRDLKGQFDKIISVEMLEAIGERELPRFFQQCQALLKP